MTIDRFMTARLPHPVLNNYQSSLPRQKQTKKKSPFYSRITQQDVEDSAHLPEMKLSCLVLLIYLSEIQTAEREREHRSSLTASVRCRISGYWSPHRPNGPLWHLRLQTAGEQRASKVSKLSDDPELQQLQRWPLRVIIRRWLCALHALHSHHALSWLFKWQRWSICALAISMSKSICLPQLGGLDALSCSCQQDQTPQDGNSGAVKSAQQGFHRVLIV